MYNCDKLHAMFCIIKKKKPYLYLPDSMLNLIPVTLGNDMAYNQGSLTDMTWENSSSLLRVRCWETKVVFL